MEFGAIQIVSSLDVCDETVAGTSSSRKFCIKSEKILKKRGDLKLSTQEPSSQYFWDKDNSLLTRSLLSRQGSFGTERIGGGRSRCSSEFDTSTGG